MLKKHSQLFEGLFAISDLLVVSFAWTLSYWIRFSSEWIPIDKGIPPFIDYLKMLLFVWLVWGFVFRRFGLYRPMRGSNRLHEVWTVIRANSLSVIVLMALTYLFREKSVPFSRLVFVIFWGLSIVCTVSSRSFIRAILRAMRRRGYNLRFALIVGSGESAVQMARSLKEHTEYGIALIGCLVSDREFRNRAREQQPVSIGQLALDSNANLSRAQSEDFLPVLGPYEDLPHFLSAGRIDQIIISLPYEDHDKLGDIIASIGDAMVDVKIVPDLSQFIQLGSDIEEFNGVPVVSLASTPLWGINLVMKRILDLTVGTVLFLACLPLMIIIALAVKLTSRGPILFSQERVGLDGKTFLIYKFRTMRVDAEAKGARFAVRDDPRVTELGAFLRKTSLDELPQLVNVILGQMSLVGPRPERPVFIREFRKHIPKYMLRHKVQAGMTGWAQVHGWRGNTSIEKRIEHDLYYIEHWSLMLDLKILVLTLINGLRHRNAY